MRERDVCALLRGTSDAAIAITPDGRIRCCNAAAERLLGRTAQEITSLYCSELLVGEGAQAETICRECCAVMERAVVGLPT